MIKYTIAVMVYNVEKYLPMCIESIVSQKGEDIEILLINDGSTDSSGKICDKYAISDSRIRVIHQTNYGVSTARNVAIKNAKGKWLIQVDGDDVLTDNAIEYIRPYENDDSDVLQFDAIEFINEIEMHRWKEKGEEMVISGNLLEEYHFQLIDRSNVRIKFPTYNLNPAWSKAWNMNFIHKNNLTYDPEVVKGEGTLFTFTASYHMKKVRIIPKLIYGYRINPQSIMHRFSQDILQNQNIQMRSYINIIRENGEYGCERIQIALKERGLYLIENAIHLGIAHPKCNWKKKEKIDWLITLCEYKWVQDAIEYAEKNGNSTILLQAIKRRWYSLLIVWCTMRKYRVVISKKIHRT